MRTLRAPAGGMMATVRATRAATIEELVVQSTPRLAALASEGVTTVEIKTAMAWMPSTIGK